jgi:hypothetical protein
MKGHSGRDDLGAAARGLGTPGSPCPESEKLLAFYMDAHPAAHAGTLAEHLARCPSCLEVSRDARLFLQAMREPVARRVVRFDRAVAAIAAGLVLVGGVSVVRWGLTPKPRREIPSAASATAPTNPTDPWRDLRIAKADYSPLESAPDVIWRGEDEGASPAPDAFVQAMEPYRHDEFAKAEARLERYLAQAPRDHRARFYLGVSRLLLGRTREALPLLRAVMEQGQGPLGREARWYAALAHLKTGEEREARSLLEVVVATSAKHRSPAESLLRTLNAGAAR